MIERGANMTDRDFNEMLQKLVDDEAERLGAGSAAFRSRHNEIMLMIDRAWIALRKEQQAELEAQKAKRQEQTEQAAQMVTLTEASRRTGISYDRLRKMCINNQIVHIKTGRKFLINWVKLTNYLNEGCMNGSQ